MTDVGPYSVVSSGYRSTLTGGDDSTLTGGYGSTLSALWWDGSRYRRVTVYPGEKACFPVASFNRFISNPP